MDIEDEADEYERCLKEEHESKGEIIAKQPHNGDSPPEADTINQEELN
jgi:hypothetical protein